MTIRSLTLAVQECYAFDGMLSSSRSSKTMVTQDIFYGSKLALNRLACGILIGLLIAVAGCRTTGNGSNSQKSAAQSASLFVGCAATVSECKNSCPARDGAGSLDPTLCPETNVPYACICPVESGVQPTPPSESTHMFVGCTPSAPECKNSCPTKQITTFQGSARCEKFEFACYCKHQTAD